MTLPEGLTLDPSAARGLQACTAAEIAIGSTSPVTCPPASKVGTVAIETDLPPGSLAGNVYLGSPGGGPLTEPPYTIYLDAESAYGVSVRLRGSIDPNPDTGRLEATFAENPQLPFSDLTLRLERRRAGAARQPACLREHPGRSPLHSLHRYACGAQLDAIPSPPAVPRRCRSRSRRARRAPRPTPAPTRPTRSTSSRADGQQYLAQVKTALPPGLLGAIPSVPLCGEPQASEGTCSSASQIGTATVTAGAGPEPYAFSGPVFLTGPYDGAPYGLSIAVPADGGTVQPRQWALRLRAHPRRARRRPVHRPRDRHRRAADDRQGRAAATEGPQRRRQPARLPLQPDQLWARSRPNRRWAPRSARPRTRRARSEWPTAAPSRSDRRSRPRPAPTPPERTARALQVNLTQGAHQANIRSVLVQLPRRLSTRLTHPAARPVLKRRSPLISAAARPARRSAAPPWSRLCCRASSQGPPTWSHTAARRSPTSTWCWTTAACA